MTDKIGPLNSLLEAVRLASSQRKGAPASTAAVRGQVNEQPSAAAPRHDVEELRRRLRAELRDLDRADAGALQRGRRAMVREITLWEFGASVLQHPEFEPMLDAVERAIGAHPRLSESYSKLLDELAREP